MLINEQSISGNLSLDKNLKGRLVELANGISGGLLDPTIINETAVHYDTKENWDSQRYLVAELGHFYIYSNAEVHYTETGEEIRIPAIKVGDGGSYLIDMPYVVFGSDHNNLTEHINDSSIHIDPNERSKWNKNVSMRINEETGTLIVEN